MPTSNGQVGRYDIRRGAIDETKLMDEIIGTDKVKNLAITVGKIDEPFHVASSETPIPGLNVALTTDWQEICFDLVDVPTWAGQVSIMAWGRTSISNTSGANQNVLTGIGIGGSGPDDETFESWTNVTAAHNETANAAHIGRRDDLVAPGATIRVGLWAKVQSGTNNQNSGFLWVQGIFRR